MLRAWGMACCLWLLSSCGSNDEPMLSAAAGHVSIAEARNARARAGADAAGGGGAGQAGMSVQRDAGIDAAAVSAVEDAGPGPDAATGPVKQKVEDTSDEVFRDDRLSTYALTISAADWDTLQRTALDEQYVPAKLEVDGQPVGNIGVRYKGAYTLSTCFENGKQVCRKVSMKLKFDKYEPDLRFHGLKHLNLHSSLNDHSQLHERVSYKLFRDFKVLAPRSIHARVMINGKYAGLFNLTEEVDGRFASRSFAGAEGNGTLYKEVWPSSSQAPDYFMHGQASNEGAPVTKIVAFANELASANSSGLGQVVHTWMDVDYMLRYLAVHTAIKHWDGPLTFWCEAGRDCINHNYFLYESPTQNRFTIVAWDMDNTFYDNVQTDEANVPEWYEPAGECVRDGSVQFMAPGCDRLVQGFSELGMDAFRAAMRQLLAGPFQVAPIQADIDRWAAQIDEAVQTDPAGSGYEDWKANVAGLRSAIETFRMRAKALRDGTN